MSEPHNREHEAVRQAKKGAHCWVSLSLVAYLLLAVANSPCICNAVVVD